MVCGLLLLAACDSGTVAGNTNAAPTRSASTADVRPCSAQSTVAPAASVPVPAASAAASDDLSALSDEFNDAGSLTTWKNLSTIEGWPSQIETLNVIDRTD
jgi:hypothetical protein